MALKDEEVKKFRMERINVKSNVVLAGLIAIALTLILVLVNLELPGSLIWDIPYFIKHLPKITAFFGGLSLFCLMFIHAYYGVNKLPLIYPILKNSAMFTGNEGRSLREQIRYMEGFLFSFSRIAKDNKQQKKLLKHLQDIYPRYLFSWDNVLEGGNEKLLSFLRGNRYIERDEDVEISKSSDGKTVRIHRDKNSTEITIQKEGDNAILTTSDGKTYDLEVKEENGKLNIYGQSEVSWLMKNAKYSSIKDNKITIKDKDGTEIATLEIIDDRCHLKRKYENIELGTAIREKTAIKENDEVNIYAESNDTKYNTDGIVPQLVLWLTTILTIMSVVSLMLLLVLPLILSVFGVLIYRKNEKNIILPDKLVLDVK